jgi:uncharacterized protein (UPF0305 family)
MKIKSSKLFLKLKKDIEPYKSIIKPNKGIIEEDSVNNKMSQYNLENFNQIINSSSVGYDEEVDEKKLDDFNESVDHYFKLNAPGNDEFKEFIKIISVYLTFIAKKPLHPPGIIFSNGARVFQRGNTFYCTGKEIFLKDNHSLCRYCICKIIS